MNAQNIAAMVDCLVRNRSDFPRGEPWNLVVDLTGFLGREHTKLDDGMTPYNAYIKLMVNEHNLELSGAEGSPAMDVVQSKMERIWVHLTPEDRKATKGFTFELDKIKRWHRGGA